MSLVVPFPPKWFLRRLTSCIDRDSESTPGAETLISHLLAFFIYYFSCCEICTHTKEGRLTYAPDAHNLSKSCHISSHLAPSLSHHAYQNTTWARHVPASAGKRTLAASPALSLSGRQIHSRADTPTSAKTPDPHHLSFSVRRAHTYTKSPAKSAARKVTCVRQTADNFRNLRLKSWNRLHGHQNFLRLNGC